MDDLLAIENELKRKSNNSSEDLLRNILFEMQYPIEDYYLAIKLLKENYPRYKDLRFAILGSYLSSTWIADNTFLDSLDDHLNDADDQGKSIIYYLHAYDMYTKCNRKFSEEYLSYLRKSVSYSKRFVNNYVRLSEVSGRKEARALIERAISNVETVWTEEELKKASNILSSYVLSYDSFIDEFILGVNMTESNYENLLAKRKKVKPNAAILQEMYLDVMVDNYC